MTKSLHEEFGENEQSTGGSDDLVRRCKELLYTMPSGRPHVDFLNLHRVPIRVENGLQPGYRVENHALIVLTCPPPPDIPLYDMTFHLACAARVVELHTQTFLSPEMKDSRQWAHPQLAEPFEIMLVICKLAYDMNYFSKNPEVEKFLKKNDYHKIYEAYATQDSAMENLMLESFNSRN